MIPPPSDRRCAAVCRNGHIISDSLAPPPRPRTSTEVHFVEGSSYVGAPPPEPTPQRFCGQCGAPVLRACKSCDAPLLGAYGSAFVGYEDLGEPESFCWGCGVAYPWATREERVGKLYDLIDHEDLDENTLLTIQEQIAVLSAPVDEETDEDRVRAGERLKRLAPKAWETGAPVLQALLTAEAKKRLGLP